MEALQDKRVRLQPECKKRLQDRIDMWGYAAKVGPWLVYGGDLVLMIFHEEEIMSMLINNSSLHVRRYVHAWEPLP